MEPREEESLAQSCTASEWQSEKQDFKFRALSAAAGAWGPLRSTWTEQNADWPLCSECCARTLPGGALPGGALPGDGARKDGSPKASKDQAGCENSPVPELVLSICGVGCGWRR